MARIRTIKPDLCTSEMFAECSPNARLLFLLLFCHCDDNGIHPASFRKAKMEVFPSDSFTVDDIEAMINELLDNGLLIEYSIGENHYWKVTGWQNKESDFYQKIDQPTYKYPLPDGEIPATKKRRRPAEQKSEDQRSDDGYFDNVRRTDGECSRRKGKEGKGISLLENTNVFPKSSPPLETEKNSNFENFWKEYPKSGKGCGKTDAKRAYGKALSSGVTPDEILTAVQHYVVYLNKTGIHPAYASKWLKDQRWTVDYQEVSDDKKQNLPDHSKTVCSCQKHFGQGVNTPEKRAKSYAWYRKRQPWKYEGEMQKWLESYEHEHGMVA